MFKDYSVSHTISSEDTLYTLAKDYKTTVQNILNANPSIDPHNLNIGDIIIIFPDINIHTSPQNNKISAENHCVQKKCTCINKAHFDLNKTMRLFWSQHVYWTRLLIISIVDMLKDTDNATTRVLQTAKDISSLFAPYYGFETASILEKLLTEHLVIGKELIIATKNNDTVNAERLNKNWFENADKIAVFLNKINPEYYHKDEVRNMFYSHLDLTSQELSHRLNHEYDKDVDTFNKVEQEAMMMADYFIDGIVGQFPDKFN